MAGPAAQNARDIVMTWREDAVERLRHRFARAVEEGDLPSSSDPRLLARYLMTVANGMSVQAVSGTSRQEMQSVADAALGNWPPV